MKDRENTITEPRDALVMLARVEMKPFTREDWYAFSGCETPDPRIGVEGKYTIVQDGAFINIVHEEDEYGGTLFELIGRN